MFVKLLQEDCKCINFPHIAAYIVLLVFSLGEILLLLDEFLFDNINVVSDDNLGSILVLYKCTKYDFKYY